MAGRRILVYGVTGSGKSTLAQRIAAKLGIPYHSVDDLAWEPNWVQVDAAVLRDRIREVCAGDNWVLDSAYGNMSDLVLERVDLIVGLDLARWRSFSRLLRRTVSRAWHKTPICNGNQESWRISFLSRESILRWHLTSFRRKRTRMRFWQGHPDFPETVLLRTPSEVERWFRELQ